MALSVRGHDVQHRASVCEVSLGTLVLGEISTVTSMMRKNARWAGAAASGSAFHSSAPTSGRGTPAPSSLEASSSSAASSSATLVPATDDSSGLRGAKSRDRLAKSTNAAASASANSNGKVDRNPRSQAGSLLAGFTALKSELRELEGMLHAIDGCWLG